MSMDSVTLPGIALTMLGLTVRLPTVVTSSPPRSRAMPRTPFNPEVVAAVERAAQATGAGYRKILSGAGHDAQYMAAIGPTGMVFVPSHDGRSHC